MQAPLYTHPSFRPCTTQEPPVPLNPPTPQSPPNHPTHLVQDALCISLQELKELTARRRLCVCGGGCVCSKQQDKKGAERGGVKQDK